MDFIFLFLGRADDTFSSLFFPTNTHHYGRQVTAVALWAEAPADIPHRGGGRAVAARRAEAEAWLILAYLYTRFPYGCVLQTNDN